jgi:hypothetical protein
MSNDNLLFARVVLPKLDKTNAAKQLLGLPDSYSFWDDYRHTKMIPLMSKGGLIASNNFPGEFNWNEYTPTLISDWFDNIVFPWMGMKSRVMALITQPGAANYEHIDCDPHELNTQQHKFRIILQGRTDTLYFITNKGNIAAPDIDNPFIMDGRWPHGMINSTDEIKVTLAVGAPWTGNTIYNNLESLMNRDDYIMPNDLTPYWKKYVKSKLD